MLEGTIELMGRILTWMSPRVKDLMDFEKALGPLIGSNHIDTMAGRAYAAFICLRERQPDITLAQIHELRAADAVKLMPMIMEAIPFWGSPQTGASRESPAPAPSDSTGPPPSPDESE